MTSALDILLADARAEPLDRAFATAGLAGLKRQGAEMVGPCPACGGVDGFALHPGKGKWNCRKAGIGGTDATGMVAHCLGLDVKRADELGRAAAAALGVAPPGEDEAEEKRLAREAALAARRASAQAEVADRDRKSAEFRDREIGKAKAKWRRAHARLHGTPAAAYLAARCGLPVTPENLSRLRLRFLADESLWHGQDEAGRPLAVHSGPVMVGAFVDFKRELIGCHLTWIDLSQPPKYRPRLISPAGEQPAGQARTLAGRPTGAPASMDPDQDDASDAAREVPTKKMRGSKKGGVIPLAGVFSARRWVGGEGIENGVAVAAAERFRPDTFYFAAGDLGNLAGPQAATGRVRHPSLVGPSGRPVMLPSPAPREQEPAARTADAMWLPDHVTDLVLLADGDSEPYWTAAQMARARARLAAPWRQVTVAWPPAGTDFSKLMAEMADV